MGKKKPATKVVITITDNAACDGVNVTMEFEPALTKDGAASPSQRVAGQILDALGQVQRPRDQAED